MHIVLFGELRFASPQHYSHIFACPSLCSALSYQSLHRKGKRTKHTRKDLPGAATSEQQQSQQQQSKQQQQAPDGKQSEQAELQAAEKKQEEKSSGYYGGGFFSNYRYKVSERTRERAFHILCQQAHFVLVSACPLLPVLFLLLVR